MYIEPDLLSPDRVAPRRMVVVSTSVNLHCTIKSRSSLLAPAHPVVPVKGPLNGCGGVVVEWAIFGQISCVWMYRVQLMCNPELFTCVCLVERYELAECVLVSVLSWCTMRWRCVQIIDPLPAMDHSEIQYADFTKNFYEEHEDISNMTPDQMVELRRKLGISVSFTAVPGCF